MIENETILLVEDDSDDEILILRALQANDIKNKVVIVRDGAEALNYLFCTNAYANRDPLSQPRLILLDLKLPKKNGLEVLRYIRANPRTHLLPVVLLSSATDEQDVIKGSNNGANSYLCKPVEYNQFVEFVGQLGSYWLRLNEPPPKPRMK